MLYFLDVKLMVKLNAKYNFMNFLVCTLFTNAKAYRKRVIHIGNCCKQ